MQFVICRMCAHTAWGTHIHTQILVQYGPHARKNTCSQLISKGLSYKKDAKQDCDTGNTFPLTQNNFFFFFVAVRPRIRNPPPGRMRYAYIAITVRSEC